MKNVPFGILTDCQKEDTDDDDNNDDEECLKLLFVPWIVVTRFIINDADDCNNILLDMTD